MATSKKITTNKETNKVTQITVTVDRVKFFKDSDTTDKGSIASANIVLGGVIKLYNISLCKSSKGDFFISFPNYKGKDGNYYNHCYIDNEEVRENIAQAILDAE